MPIKQLQRPHRSRDGAPTVDRVDSRIFQARYFTHCMQCTFCHDRCCSYGVDVDAENHARLLAVADQLEPWVGVPRAAWFTDQWVEDPEFPGGRYTRTRVAGGRCVFLNRRGRGCLIHAFALSRGVDYHELKPLVSTLYPVTFDEGLLHPSTEVGERDLVCLDQGPTLYRGVREELLHYFGPALVAELDALEAEEAALPPGRAD
jgi:hypothetical protein